MQSNKKVFDMNPFSFGNIVRGDEFYDRTRETELLVSTLTGGNNVVLFAPRRFGKTSLVFKVMEQLESQGVVCVYIDLMATYSLESLVELYVNAVKEKQGRIETFAKNLSKWVKSIRPKVDFGPDGMPSFSLDFENGKADAATVTEVFDLPQHLAQKGKRVVVVIDEFQEITRFQKYGLEGVLRSIIQRQKNVNYIFLGSKTHLMMQMFDSKKRPFYNSGIQVQIGPLPQEDTIRFLQQRFASDGMVIGEEQCKYLIECVGDIPYYIQLLASVLWQRVVTNKHTITNDDIDLCVDDIIGLKGDYYQEQFDKYSERQKSLLKAIAVDGCNIFSSRYIQRHRLAPASTVQKSVAVLTEDGVIEKEGGNYFISDPFLRRYIIAKYGL